MSVTLSNAFSIVRNELLTIYDDREAASIAYLLMEFIGGYNRLQLLTKGEEVLTPRELQRLEEARQRLLRREPLQYVTGFTWFCGLRINVTPAVLIPRPETEELVQWICSQPGGDQKIMADLGTGSGCIALALKKNLPGATVWGVDISAEALKIAAENADVNKLDVQLIRGDLLSEGWVPQLPPLDVIVSNPPYVMQEERKAMPVHVRDHEPGVALFVPDSDPLVFYRTISRHALMALKPGGEIYFEINETYGKEVVELLHEAGYVNTELRKDITGRDRMVRGQLLR